MLDDDQKLKNGLGIGAVVVVIAITILANAAAIVVPILLPLLAQTRGLTETQGGLFAMAEYGGIGLGAMGCALQPAFVEWLNWRRTTLLGLAAVIAANLAMATPMGFLGLFTLGLVAGIGAGLVNAVLYLICAEGDGARRVAAFQAAQMGIGAVGVALVSPIIDRHGEAGAFLAVAVLGAAALLLCPLMPTRGTLRPQAEHNASPQSVGISGLGWAVVLGLFVFFVASGASYGFLGYMGLAWGGMPADVANALSGMMFIGMAGPLVVIFVGSRFGYGWPLAVTIAGSLLGLILLIAIKPVAAFLPIGGLLYLSLNTAPAYLFDVLTDVDSSPGAAMMMGASQLSGFAIGPAIAGYLVTPDYMRANAFILSLCVVASLIIFGVLWLHRREGRKIPVNSHARVEC